MGWLAPTAGIAMEPIGTTFVNSMKMLIGPIVFLTIVGGIASVADLKKVGMTGIKALTYFQVGTILAMIFGLVAINIFRLGDGVNADASTIETSASAAKLIDAGQHRVRGRQRRLQSPPRRPGRAGSFWAAEGSGPAEVSELEAGMAHLVATLTDAGFTNAGGGASFRGGLLPGPAGLQQPQGQLRRRHHRRGEHRRTDAGRKAAGRRRPPFRSPADHRRRRAFAAPPERWPDLALTSVYTLAEYTDLDSSKDPELSLRCCGASARTPGTAFSSLGWAGPTTAS